MYICRNCTQTFISPTDTLTGIDSCPRCHCEHIEPVVELITKENYQSQFFEIFSFKDLQKMLYALECEFGREDDDYKKFYNFLQVFRDGEITRKMETELLKSQKRKYNKMGVYNNENRRS